MQTGSPLSSQGSYPVKLIPWPGNDFYQLESNIEFQGNIPCLLYVQLRFTWAQFCYLLPLLSG